MNNCECEYTLDPKLIEEIIANKEVRRKVTYENHMMFFSIYLGEYLTYPMANFHWDMFDLTQSNDRMAVLMAFRGSGKSTIFTLSYPIWAILGVQQKKFVVIIAQTQQQAKLYISNIRRELESNELLRNDLGPFYEREEEWSAGTLVFPTHNARITALSTEQSIRGQRHGSHRPDLIICDDIEDLDSVRTHEGRSRTFNWLLGDVIPAGDSKTKVVVIGNMLHEESVLMRLKNEIASKKRDGVFKMFPLLDENGEIAWPGKFKEMDEIFALKSLIGDDIAWSREYLLRIISDAEQVVHPEWINYHDGEPPTSDDPRYNLTGIGVDLAIAQNETADFTSIVIGRVVDNKLYILPNPVNERLTFPDTVQRIKNIHDSFGPKERIKIFIEKVGYQEATIQQLKSDGIMVAEGVNPGGQDKRSRIALTTNHIKSGNVLFSRYGNEDLIRQLVGFGKETHDDIVDALTILILQFSKYLHAEPTVWIIDKSTPRNPDFIPHFGDLRRKQF